MTQEGTDLQPVKHRAIYHKLTRAGRGRGGELVELLRGRDRIPYTVHPPRELPFELPYAGLSVGKTWRIKANHQLGEIRLVKGAVSVESSTSRAPKLGHLDRRRVVEHDEVSRCRDSRGEAGPVGRDLPCHNDRPRGESIKAYRRCGGRAVVASGGARDETRDLAAQVEAARQVEHVARGGDRDVQHVGADDKRHVAIGDTDAVYRRPRRGWRRRRRRGRRPRRRWWWRGRWRLFAVDGDLREHERTHCARRTHGDEAPSHATTRGHHGARRAGRDALGSAAVSGAARCTGMAVVIAHPDGVWCEQRS